MNKKKILTSCLAIFTLIFAILSWWSVRNAVTVPDSSTWILPITLFSLYVILICLDIILLQNLLFLEFLLIGSLVLSLIFAFSWINLVAVLIAGYFLFLASRKVREDMEQNIKINIWKSLNVGKTPLLFSIAVLIALQYFFTINSFEVEKKVPHFDASFITKKIAIPFLSSVNPEFKALEDETLTVDEFILQSQSDALEKNNFSEQNEQLLDAQIPSSIPETQREAIKKQALENLSSAESELLKKNQELILATGREQFSDMVGVPLQGNERISDLFIGLINNKINSYFNPKIEGEERSPVFSIILTTVLFLTIYPIASILSLVWFLVVKLAVAALFKTGVITVKVVTVSKEVME